MNKVHTYSLVKLLHFYNKLYPLSMWWKEGIQINKGYLFKKRKLSLVDSKFHWKYFSIVLFGSMFASFMAFGLTWYFVNQNYNIFINLAYEHSPSFVVNLEFERKWIQVFFICSFIFLNLFISSVIYKVLRSVLMPLEVMKKHIANLTKGDWGQSEIRVRADSDYQDLIQTYNYFYRTLQRHSNHDLHKLMSIEVSKNAHKSREVWKSLVETKYEQLNGSSLDFEKAHDSTHAS